VVNYRAPNIRTDRYGGNRDRTIDGGKDTISNLAMLHTDCHWIARAIGLSVVKPAYGECLAAERVGQQPLKGLHLAVFASLFRLDHTRLEPSNLAIAIGPIDNLRVRRAIGGRTGPKLLHCHLLFLLRRLVKLSSDERPWGSLPTLPVTSK
jgi:hypothetical protein